MLIAALLIQNFRAIQERTFPHSPKIPLQQTIIISYHHKYITGMTESVKRPLVIIFTYQDLL